MDNALNRTKVELKFKNENLPVDENPTLNRTKVELKLKNIAAFIFYNCSQSYQSGIEIL